MLIIFHYVENKLNSKIYYKYKKLTRSIIIFSKSEYIQQFNKKVASDYTSNHIVWW